LTEGKEIREGGDRGQGKDKATTTAHRIHSSHPDRKPSNETTRGRPGHKTPQRPLKGGPKTGWPRAVSQEKGPVGRG